MSERPDHVHCIADTHQDNIGKALCGRVIGGHKLVPYVHPSTGETEGTIKQLVEREFCFESVDHWFLNGRNEGHLLGCRECVAEVTRVALENESSQ